MTDQTICDCREPQPRRRFEVASRQAFDALDQRHRYRRQDHEPEENSAREPGLAPAEKLDEDDQAEDAEEDRRHAVQHVEEEREPAAQEPVARKIDSVGERETDRRRQRHQKSRGDQDERADHVVEHAARGSDQADLFGEKAPTDGGQAAERNRCEDRQQRRAGNRRARKRQRGKQAVSESAGVHGLLPPLRQPGAG